MDLRRRLGALAMAAVIPFGGGAVLALSGLLATTTPALAAACWDRSCYGIDPQTSGCSASGYSVFTPTAIRDSAGTQLGTEELRYSSSCGANWARTTAFSQFAGALWADIYNNLGQHQAGDYNLGSGTLLWSYMIGGAGETDWACGQIVWQGGSGSACTPKA